MKEQRVKINVELRVGGKRKEGKSHTVKGYDAFICMMPVAFNGFAKEFLKAAEGIETVDDFSFVRCFLYCKSIELALKAFLLAKNVPIGKLKSRRLVGHNLERALEEAELKGLTDIVEVAYNHKEELRKANHLYKEKMFEYFDNYELAVEVADFPNLSVLSEFASMLVEKLERLCFESVHAFVEKSRGKRGRSRVNEEG